MNQFLDKQIKESLALVIASFKNPKDADNFLKSFLTEKEHKILSRRLAVLYWLTKKRNYSNIQTNLKVSSSTISQATSLMSKKPIQKALKEIDADIWSEKWSKKIKSLLN